MMEHDPETVSDFEREIQGQTHLHSTCECSRGVSGLFDAYAALNYPGGDRIVQPTAGTMPTTSAVAFALVCSPATAHKAGLPRNSGYHRSLFTWRGKVGLSTNRVEAIAHFDDDACGKYTYIAGDTAVFMNPACGREQMDAFIAHIRGCP